MEKIELLIKPSLSIMEVAEIEGCSRRKAFDIMKMCRLAYDGKIPMNCHKITTDSYLRYCGYPKGTWLEIVKGKGETL